MRKLTIALLTASVLGTSAAAAIAQDHPPPPWFGGRVEMPEHGFAVTFPEDWVAFDTGVGPDAQVEALAVRFGVAADEFADLSDTLLAVGAVGLQLVAFSGSEQTNLDELPLCAFAILPDGARRIDEGFVSSLYQGYLDGESTRDVEPPTPVDLRSGPGWLMTMTGQSLYEPGFWGPAALYLGAGDKDGFLMTCTASERPEDDWLSIAETFEFLPAEE